MSCREGDAQARNTADAVARRSYGKLVAFLAARTRDVAAAEDALSEAFLMSPTTMGQRLVRAKDKIRQAGIPFRIPEHEELPSRLGAVLDAIYAAFAEGWADPGGTDVARRDLPEEALFLGRLVAELL